MKHTPGPWALSDEICPLVTAPSAPYYIAQVLMYTEGETGSLRDTADADARLIAAAPELLAQLRRIVAAADRMKTSTPIDGLIDEARATIAALEG